IAHPATQAALAACAALAAAGWKPQRILDVGCGSGLLSLSALELWPQARLVAADISPQAVADAEGNLRAAAAEEAVHVVRSDGFSHPLIRKTAPYDLILCNLLAELLISFSSGFSSYLASQGMAVLSGMLRWQKDQVRAAYTVAGFETLAEYACESWHALLLKNAGK
ncbi:MAG: 50S ribosomal protein L11 methyltransferase, partial [Alphaproteobacteria bacterium]|nr:50S ribosomal protein L11 methyltransferase [Alphaproteobacteria bacterium]